MPAADQQQHEPAAGERHRDLALLLLGGEARAEVGVDRLELGGLRGLEEAPAGDARDLAQRLRVGRHRDRLGRAGERVGQLDLAARGAERDRVDRDLQRLRLAGDVERPHVAGGVLAVGEQHDDRGQAARAAAVSVRDRRARGLDAAAQRVAHRGAAVGDEAVERLLDGLALGRRRDGLLGVVGERHEPEAQLVGQLVGERVAGLDGGGEAVGLDVGGPHRARDVGDHHHRGLALRRRDGALRPRERDHERAEREQQQQRRQVPAPARARGGEAGQQRGVAEARGVVRGGGAA